MNIIFSKIFHLLILLLWYRNMVSLDSWLHNLARKLCFWSDQFSRKKVMCKSLKFYFLKIWKSENMKIWKSENLKIWKSENLKIWKKKLNIILSKIFHLLILLLWYRNRVSLDSWWHNLARKFCFWSDQFSRKKVMCKSLKFYFLKIWKSENMKIWKSESMKIWKSENLKIWHVFTLHQTWIVNIEYFIFHNHAIINKW